MVFSSVIFLVYFLPVFLVLYFIMPGYKWKNLFLLFSSILFYAWGAPKFIFAILATTTLDFYFIKLLDKTEDKEIRRFFLIASLVLNVGMLFYFKYCNFFVDNFNGILRRAGITEVSWTKVVLPIGISFYTFESITYMMDVYRKVHKPLKNFWHYQLYIILFPKLIAGPIIRYHEISDQIADRSANDTSENRLNGFIRFCLGLGKKVLIANVMAKQADYCFGMPSDQLTTGFAWLGMISYTFQIYFDFSGYSDMAIGIGKMIGFKFPENFDNPYISKSITEFWRRWHITLGSWMRNYLYIPLGGNKVDNKLRLYFNLWIVFIASGFWHGAAWTFILWGIYHGFFLVTERIFFGKILSKLPGVFSMAYSFIIVSLGWVLFRAENFNQAKLFWKRILKINLNSFSELNLSKEFMLTLLLAFIFSFFAANRYGRQLQQFFYYKSHSVSVYAWLIIMAVGIYYTSLAYISAGDLNPFIYFRF